MSIASATARMQFTLAGVPQTLNIFAFNVAADLVVSDGANILTLNSDYTVTGGGYNSANQLQTGSVTVVGTGAHSVIGGDVITIYRGITPIQSTTFSSTGILTPLMIEQDDDKLTCEIQQLSQQYYNPFPPVAGSPQVVVLGWITAPNGGIRTSIDSLDVTSIAAIQLPLMVAVSISDDFEMWKLRAMSGGDPAVTTLPFFVVPVTNPNSLIWVRVQ